MTTERSAWSGQRRALGVAVGLLTACVSFSCVAWTVQSRELVDLEFATESALSILISAPSVTEPGLYRWLPDEAEPTRLCRIASPSFFSFDRKTVIERIRGSRSSLRIYSATNCRLLARVTVEGVVVDADVRAGQIVVATRDTDRNLTLQLLNRRGKALARVPVGRNVEMGFAPDGRSIVNFDLSDVGARFWSLPGLRRSEAPPWARSGEVTFVPGSGFVKHYLDGKLLVARWPSGAVLSETPANVGTRLRQLSRDGRAGVLHERVGAQDALDWIDFSTGKRSRLAHGSIDNAALNPSGRLVAWTDRRDESSSESSNLVDVRRSAVAKNGEPVAVPR